MKNSELKKVVLGIVFILFVLNCCGQEKDSIYYLSGKVISKQGKFPIALAHVININRKRGVVADTLGRFGVWVRPYDTLNISAIGFSYEEFFVNGYLQDSNIVIELESRYYEIPEASISYLGTYKQFEYKVLNLDLPEIKLNPEFEKLFNYVEPPPLFVEPQVTSPASLIYVLFSKDAKDKKKYLALEDEGKIKDKVRERYNEHIIRNLTGLEGVEARKFMEFCNFQDKYILSIGDYNLYSEILLRYKAYKKTEEDSLKSE